MGTLKPSGLCPASADGDLLLKARKVAVVTIGGLRDCQPNLIIKQFRRYPALKGIDFTEVVLPSPLGKTHRNMTALDLARYGSSRGCFLAGRCPEEGLRPAGISSCCRLYAACATSFGKNWWDCWIARWWKCFPSLRESAACVCAPVS